MADAYPMSETLVERIGRAVVQIHAARLRPDIARLAPLDLLGDSTFTDDLLADLESLRTLGNAADSFLRRLHALVWPQRELIRSFIEESQAYAARVGDIGPAPSAGGSGHPLVLCHGDVWGGNLIAGAPPALIFLDWESACLAPPERDAYGFIGATFEAFAAGYRTGMPLGGVGSAAPAEADHEQEARNIPFTWNADLLAVYAYRKQLRNLAQWLHNLLHEQQGDEQRENDLLMIDEHCLGRWAGLEPALDQPRAARRQ